MSIAARVIAQDPVSPRDLFDAMRDVVGSPKDWTLHDGPDSGDVHMCQARPGQDAAALVSVHFPAAGDPYPPENPGDPDGYIHAAFCTGAFTSDEDAMWHYHAGLVHELGQWLDARGIRWCWSFEGAPWIHGALEETGDIVNGH
jgi:hypothetical protein